MKDLIEKLQSATGPDRELDGELGVLRGEPQAREFVAHPGLQSIVPRFTASLDAALTLVPEGWQIDNWFIGTDKSSRLDLRELTLAKPRPMESGVHYHSAAIALCIAALKARASLSSQERGS